MRAFKIVTAALLVAAVAALTGPPISDAREHILGADSADVSTSAIREHIL
ncbi:hypothetical protein ABZ345_18635 [Lentzea sp. NPDC005914]